MWQIYLNYHQSMGILTLKKRVKRDKYSFATKQRMFRVFAIDEILRYRGTRFPHFMPPWCYILNCNSFLWSMLPWKIDLTLKLPLLLTDNPHWKAVHGQPAGHPSWKPPFQNICSWSSKQYFHDVFIQHEIMAVIYSCFFLFFFSLRSLGGQNKRLGSWSW